ncbi:MAG: HAD family hydrolase [Candidatus Aenigmarchaeota archaeon]|nr:HAD family hydrolase [Candidatus Aenigmarchaeota archaeon]
MIPVAAFDIDGTLIDINPQRDPKAYGRLKYGVLSAVKALFPHTSDDELSDMFDTITHLLRGEWDNDLSTGTDYAVARRLIEAFIGLPNAKRLVDNKDKISRQIENLTNQALEEMDKFYTSDGQHNIEAFPGVANFLELLCQQGVMPVIVSGNTRRVAEAKLRICGLYRYFEADRFLRTFEKYVSFLDGDFLPSPVGYHGDRGTRAENLNKAVNLCYLDGSNRGERPRCVYFGDRIGDYLAAKKAGVPFVLVDMRGKRTESRIKDDLGIPLVIEDWERYRNFYGTLQKYLLL